jgi:predicted phage terminase large subunit-like protein
VTSWDLKLKNREAGDFVVGQCWWAVGEARFCMDQLRGQYDYATTENAIALLAVRNPHASTHVVESAGSADEVVPELRRPIQGYVLPDEIADRLGMTAEEREKVQRLRRQGMGNIKMAPATEGSKQVRAREYIAPPAAVGNVRFPAHAPWVPALLDEYAAFPNGQHDDQVDASSQGLKELRGKNTKPGARRPTGTIQR